MTAPWKKAIRDVWGERGRTIAAIVAIAVGVAAFHAVLSSWAILTRELDQQYLATDPASATLWIDELDDDLVRELSLHPDLARIEQRAVLDGRIRAGATTRNVRLFVADDFRDARISRVDPEAGAWPPGRGEILLERDAFQVLGAEIGDNVTIRTTGGPERTLLLSGSVHDVGQAQARMENLVYGYVTPETLVALGRDPAFDRVLVLVNGDRSDQARVRRIARELAATVEREGRRVTRVEVPAPGEHPHASIMGLLLLIMASFGLFILLLSGVLVVNLMLALMTAQVRQVGVMRALGGTRWQISTIYLAEALLLGLAALLVAFPIGLAGTRALCRWQAGFLNFDVTSFEVPPSISLLVIAVAIGVPLVAAAVPVWKGTGVVVREALADYGVRSDAFGTGSLDRLVARIGGPMRPILLSLRNAIRHRGRLVLTIATLAAGGLFFLSALNVRAMMIGTLDQVFASRRYDLAVALTSLPDHASVERAVRATPGVQRWEGWITTEGSLADEPTAAPPMHGAATRHGSPIGGDRFPVIAPPAGTDLIAPQLAAGRWLQAGDSDAIVINEALAAEHPRLEIGETVSIRMGHHPIELLLVGIVREPFHPAVAYVVLEEMQRLGGLEGRANSIRVALDDAGRSSVDGVKDRLERNLEAEGIHAARLVSNAESRYGFDQHMLMIYWFLIVTSAAIGAVGALGLLTSMSLSVLERRREVGILGAVGASPSIVAALLVAEGAAIAIASWALAAVLSWPLSVALGDHLFVHTLRTRLEYSFEPVGPLVWLAVSILIGVLATLLPALQAARLPIREALEYE